MTLQDLYTLICDYRAAVLLMLFCAPWLALGLCISIPGTQEEPFILNFNLSMAVLSLLMAIGYLWYTTRSEGFDNVIQQGDILLTLAPCYYVGVSLWVSQQRLPLAQIPIVRIIQGAALIGASYLGFAWLLKKMHIFILAVIPYQVVVMLLLGLVGLAYMGYLKIAGAGPNHTDNRYSSGSAATSQRPSQRPSQRSTQSHPKRPTPAPSKYPNPRNMSIDEELEALRRKLKNDEGQS
jgi:hypothetical protein